MTLAYGESAFKSLSAKQIHLLKTSVQPCSAKSYDRVLDYIESAAEEELQFGNDPASPILAMRNALRRDSQLSKQARKLTEKQNIRVLGMLVDCASNSYITESDFRRVLKILRPYSKEVLDEHTK